MPPHVVDLQGARIVAENQVGRPLSDEEVVAWHANNTTWTVDLTAQPAPPGPSPVVNMDLQTARPIAEQELGRPLTDDEVRTWAQSKPSVTLFGPDASGPPDAGGGGTSDPSQPGPGASGPGTSPDFTRDTLLSAPPVQPFNAPRPYTPSRTDTPITDANSALELVRAVLTTYGLETLIPWAEQQFWSGQFDPDLLNLRIRETPQFRERFPAIFEIEALQQQGGIDINPLSV